MIETVFCVTVLCFLCLHACDARKMKSGIYDELYNVYG